MDSLKTLGIRLSDIWVACRTEMTEMNGKIKRMGDCLKTMDLIITYLTKTNETYVEVIDKCPIDCQHYPEVEPLIHIIRDLEECIQRENDNLMVLKMSLKSNSRHKVVDLIHNWDKCVKMRDKCIQTTEELFNTNIECNEDIVVKSETNQRSRQTFKRKSLNGSNAKKFSRDYHKLMDTLILPEHKRDDHYVCNETDCHFQTPLKYRLYCHLKRHQIPGLSDTNFRRQEVIDDLVIPLWDPMIKKFVCNRTNCLVSMSNKKLFYAHMNGHITSGTDDHRQECESPVKPEAISKRYSGEDVSRDYGLNSTTITNHLNELPLIDGNYLVVDNTVEIMDTNIPTNIEYQSDAGCDGADNYDSDFNGSDVKPNDKELSNKRQTKRQMRLQAKIVSNRERREKLIDSLILPEHIRPDGQYGCIQTGCGFRNQNKKRFYHHLRRHSLSKSQFKYEESVDDVVMPMRDEINNTYRCSWPECTFELPIRRQFYAHYKRHETMGTDPERERQELRRHEVIRQEQQRRKHELVEQYRVGDQFVCTVIGCDGFSTANKQIFRRHLNGHKGPRRTFDKTLERPYVCEWPECGMAFKMHQHMSGHIKNIHMRIKDYPCDWPNCTYRGHVRSALQEHKRTHTGEKPFVCHWPGCDYKCGTKWSLTAHTRKHTGEKPYACDFPDCGFRFTQPCALTAHKRKHTGEKPCFCPEKGCGKQFSTLAGVHSHRKIYHRNGSRNKKLKTDGPCESKPELVIQNELIDIYQLAI